MLQITYVELASIKPYPNNARTHSEKQVAQIADSIRQFGFTNPILLDGAGELIAGHGRLQAAKLIGLKTVPAITLGNLTPTQVQALRIADNQIALNSGWNDDMLRAELHALKIADFDLKVVGFDAATIANVMFPKAESHDDEFDGSPNLSDADAVTKPGDVWMLGSHRLVCGDSTDAATVALALNGAKPHLMVTDPPYGVEYDPAWRQKAGLTNGGAFGIVKNDNRADWRAAWALFPGDVAYVWCASTGSHIVADSLIASGFVLRSQIIWNKSSAAIGRSDYHWKHEPCWYVVRTGKNGRFNGDRKQTTVWDIAKPSKSETGHSTQKPIDCMLRPILNNSVEGDTIYEPFSGSGTTLIACEKSNRKCIAIELSPAYVDLAVKRWQSLTGKLPQLQRAGQKDAVENSLAD